MDLQNLLIFRIGHLGDTLVALPALWAIRRAFPGSRLTLLTNVDSKNPHYLSAKNILPEQGLIDDWISYPTGLSKVGTAAAMMRLSLDMRRRKFDSVIYLMPRIRAAEQINRDVRFFNLSGIKSVIGAKYLRQNILSGEIPKPTPVVEPEFEYLLSCLSHEGIEVGETIAPDLLLTDSERYSAKNWLHGQAGENMKEKALLAIAPGSKWESKIWHEERFAEVVNRLIENYSCYPIIFGGAEDRKKGERLLAGWKTGSNAAGELSVRESAALLSGCKLYLGNDTGTMHLAATAGTPCVAIFAAVDWKGRWLPFGTRNRIFRKTVECEGCHTPDCFNNKKCLNLVETDEVYNACVEVLSSV